MDKKNKRILIISSIIALIVFAISITYAYFQSQIDNGDKKDVDVLTDTTDQLTFDIDNNINLSINQFNFGPGAGDLVSSAKGTAKLKANSTNNNATYNYYVYFKISTNTFIYTTEDQKTEILLQITDPEGNKVTAVDGLTYNEELQGFDITTAKGTFEIAKTYEITSTSSTIDTIQEWNFTAKFINLDSDQEQNTGKSMNGIVVMQRIVPNTTLANYCNTGNHLAGCIKKYADTSIIDVATNVPSTKIYHHNGSITSDDGTVLDANDGSYRYAGNDTTPIKEEYKETYKTLRKTSATTEGALISFMCGEEESYIGATCNEENQYYFLKYDEAKTPYDHPNKALDQAVKDGYVTRNYVNNFVCFGSTDETCPVDNLYRIIGVFDDKIKLIKYDYANENLLGADGDRATTNGSTIKLTYYKETNAIVNYYYWNKTNYASTYEKHGFYNIWEESALNKINLNTNYIANIDNNEENIKWSDKIALTNWNVGGNLYNVLRLAPARVYNSEIRYMITTVPSTYQAKIGLMYISDLGFARESSLWEKALSVLGRGWMSAGVNEWTITRFSNDAANYNRSVAAAGPTGQISIYSAGYVNSSARGVRPVFYLNSDVTYKSGDGSYENPIRIEV